MGKDSGLLILALVAVVAVVGLVMVLRGGATGGTMVLSMSGDASGPFDNALSSESVGAYGSAENTPCWSDNGQIKCAPGDTAKPQWQVI
ncbi:MAG: hypothetical protein ACE5FT_01680 [Candidatus Nanoarchaeia archaeon]